MSNVGGLESGSLDDVVDDGGEIVDTNLLDGPRPVSRIGSSEMSVRHLEVGSDVGHVDVVTLFEQVEGLSKEVASVTATVERMECPYERSFFVDDEGDRVGENTVLKNDRVTDW